MVKVELYEGMKVVVRSDLRYFQNYGLLYVNHTMLGKAGKTITLGKAHQPEKYEGIFYVECAHELMINREMIDMKATEKLHGERDVEISHMSTLRLIGYESELKNAMLFAEESLKTGNKGMFEYYGNIAKNLRNKIFLIKNTGSDFIDVKKVEK